MSTTAARELAERHLALSMPRRWKHVSGVAATAARVQSRLIGNSDVLVRAAWLHDIGYAPTAAATGFHPLDGARFLRDQGIDECVVNLVAHHSHAVMEAEERGVDRELLDEFPFEASLPHDALCFCDMTTGPDGQQMVVRDRLAEIRERYGRHDLVTRFITRAEPSIVETVERVGSQLAAAAQSR